MGISESNDNLDIFSQIYEENVWGFGSGTGSLVENCYPLIGWLQVFLSRNKIQSMTDYGCGDWQWMQYVGLTGIDYLGIDVVESVITKNQERFSQKNIQFRSGSILSNIRGSDLALMKDVLQHLPNSSVNAIVDSAIKSSKFVISINGHWGDRRANPDILPGGYRAIDLSAPPFEYNVTNLYEYYPSSKEVKKVIQLVSRNSTTK